MIILFLLFSTQKHVQIHLWGNPALSTTFKSPTAFLTVFSHWPNLNGESPMMKGGGYH